LKDESQTEISRGLTDDNGELSFKDIRLKYDEEYSLIELKTAGHQISGPWTIKTSFKDGKPILFIDGKRQELDEQFNRFRITLNIANDLNLEEFKNSVTIDKRDIETEKNLKVQYLIFIT
jgi:Cna protein B-type domain.